MFTFKIRWIEYLLVGLIGLLLLSPIFSGASQAEQATETFENVLVTGKLTVKGALELEGLAPPKATATPTTGGRLAEGTYIYQVTAFNPIGETTGIPLQVTVKAPDNAVELSWEKVEGAKGYRIYRDGGRIAEVKAAETEFTDTGLPTDPTKPVPQVNTSGGNTRIGGDLSVGGVMTVGGLTFLQGNVDIGIQGGWTTLRVFGNESVNQLNVGGALTAPVLPLNITPLAAGRPAGIRLDSSALPGGRVWHVATDGTGALTIADLSFPPDPGFPPGVERLKVTGPGGDITLNLGDPTNRPLGNFTIHDLWAKADRLAITGSPGDITLNLGDPGDPANKIPATPGTFKIADLAFKESRLEITNSGDIILNLGDLNNPGNFRIADLIIGKDRLEITGGGEVTLNLGNPGIPAIGVPGKPGTFRIADLGSAQPLSRLLIDDQGNVGIGTEQPGATLHVVSQGADKDVILETKEGNVDLILKAGESQGEAFRLAALTDGGFQLISEAEAMGGTFSLPRISISPYKDGGNIILNVGSQLEPGFFAAGTFSVCGVAPGPCPLRVDTLGNVFLGDAFSSVRGNITLGVGTPEEGSGIFKVYDLNAKEDRLILGRGPSTVGADFNIGSKKGIMGSFEIKDIRTDATRLEVINKNITLGIGNEKESPGIFKIIDWSLGSEKYRYPRLYIGGRLKPLVTQTPGREETEGGDVEFNIGDFQKPGIFKISDLSDPTEKRNRLIIDEKGNVGIGIPLIEELAHKLHVNGDIKAEGSIITPVVQASREFDLLPGEFGQEWLISHSVIVDEGRLTPDLCVAPGRGRTCTIEIGPQVGEGDTNILCISDVASPNCLVHITPEGSMKLQDNLMVERDLSIAGLAEMEDLTVYGILDVRGKLEGGEAEFQNLHLTGNLRVEGAKFFIQQHPTDQTKEITYASLEGPEVGVYVRGEGQLQDGEAVIELPESFRLVASQEGLTVQLTPIGQWLKLYVIELTPERLVVGEADHANARFYYLVQGIRKGYEGFEPIQSKSEPKGE